MYPKKLWRSITIILLLAACNPAPRVTPSVVPSEPSETPSTVASALPSQTATGKLPPETSPASEQNLLPTTQPGRMSPYPDAPLCADSGEAHDNSLFHTLWDDIRGCHYDHEHGQNPFTPEVAATFPGLDLRASLGDVGIGHTNPSSPKENTHKHGGFKWQVLLDHPHGCEGYQGSEIGVSASVIQYHNLGDYSMEFEARVHSALALLRQCRTDNPTDYGYVYVVQHVDYGQRVVPYQGAALPYPDAPSPAYDPGRGPYFTLDCIGDVQGCRPSREYVFDHNANANSIWTSQPDKLVGSGSHLFELLFRVRDNYQLLDYSDQSHPFTFVWLCSKDNGLTYSPIQGCRYNNSTGRIHEIYGIIPSEWDNLAGLDTDERVGRITGEGFVTHFGDLNPDCTAPGPDCHPIKMIQAFVGYYGSQLVAGKIDQFSPEAQPERDIYFCGKQVCLEDDPGAMSSGWIGQNN
jgi:hypothetical protein